MTDTHLDQLLEPDTGIWRGRRGRRGFLRGLGLGGAASVAAVATTQSPALAAATNHATVILIAAQDAPGRVKQAAIRVCSGTNDEQQINLIINALASTGAVIQLSEGTFNLSGPIRMRKRITLLGRGRATIVKAQGTWNAHDGTLGAIIQPIDGSVSKTRVSFMTIDGNYQNIQGIYYNVSGTAGFDETPDSKHIFSDLYIRNTGSHAFHMEGSENRGVHVNMIRVWNPGGHGYLLSAPDAYYSHCEVGSSGLAGFQVDSSNLHFNQCKSWYSDGDGWDVGSWRNIFTSCEAQDNEGHGFYVTAGPNTFTGCQADSNAFLGTNEPAADKDGFHIVGSRNALVGCTAFDKNESQRGVRQRYGFYLANNAKFTQVLATVRENRVGGLGGPGATSADNNVSVLGG